MKPSLYLTIFLAAGFAVLPAHAQSGTTPQTPPPAASESHAKRPPQAKSKAELDAYNAANAATDLATVEKAATDFATKYPASELRLLLWKSAMRKAQVAASGEKTEAFAQKVQELDADDPEALLNLASAIVEHSQP